MYLPKRSCARPGRKTGLECCGASDKHTPCNLQDYLYCEIVWIITCCSQGDYEDAVAFEDPKISYRTISQSRSEYCTDFQINTVRLFLFFFFLWNSTYFKLCGCVLLSNRRYVVFRYVAACSCDHWLGGISFPPVVPLVELHSWSWH